MKTKILQKLSEIEAEKQIEILYAVESGSRAWGFASPDSDFDIRFIYKHPADYYLQLWEKADLIEFMTPDDLDGSGWDLAKALKLLAKSNGSLLEWLFSPVVYKQNDVFLVQMQSLAKESFSPIANLHHYLGTTQNFMEVCQNDKVKLKSYFYALRSALAGKWIIENNTIPPVAFAELLPLAPQQIQDKIQELLAVKLVQDEKYMCPNEPLITQYLLDLIAFNKNNAGKLSGGKKMNAEFEAFFKEEIKRS